MTFHKFFFVSFGCSALNEEKKQKKCKENKRAIRVYMVKIFSRERKKKKSAGVCMSMVKSFETIYSFVSCWEGCDTTGEAVS